MLDNSELKHYIINIPQKAYGPVIEFKYFGSISEEELRDLKDK